METNFVLRTIESKACKASKSRLILPKLSHKRKKDTHFCVSFMFLTARVGRRYVHWDAPPIDPFDSACHFILKNKKSLISMSDFLFFKAPIRIELMNKGFADLCLTAWLWRITPYFIGLFHTSYSTQTSKETNLETNFVSFLMNYIVFFRIRT